MPDLITEQKHPLFVAASRLNQNAPRQQERKFLLEGAQQVLKTIHARITPERVLLREDVDPQVTEQLLKASIPLSFVKKGLFPKLMGTGYDTNCMAVAVMPMQQLALHDLAQQAEGIVLVAECLQDPRNCGMLVRTADAAGVKAVVFIQPCGDLYSRAGVRATTGSIADVPVCIVDSSQAAIQAFRQSGWRQVGSTSRSHQAHWDAPLKAPLCLWVGTEDSGLTADTRGSLDEMATIPMGGGAHSLNVVVASGILLFEARRQNR